jgi:hypothetical protein
MNGKKTIEHKETIHEQQPSAVAVENERRVTKLEEGQLDMQRAIGRLETHMETFMTGINSKLDKITHRPAGTYIGIISLIMGAIGSAAALIVFVQDARLEPLRAEVKAIHEDDDRSFDQWILDYTMTIRHDQVMRDKGLIDAATEKNYTPPKYPRSHGRTPR